MARSLPPGRRIFLGAALRDSAGARSLASRMGSSTAALNFPLLFPPTLVSVTPSTGSSAGGTVVDLAGMNFRDGATVTFDGIPATGITFVSSSHITCTTPAHAVGVVDVTVTNPDAQFSTLVGGFTYGIPSMIIAVGDGGAGARSLDGGATFTTLAAMPGGINWRAVAYGNGRFVAVGSAGEAAYSLDGGDAWISSSTGTTDAYRDMIFAGGRFIAVGISGGNTAVTRKSTDGITWTDGGPNTGAISVAGAVAFDGTQFVFLGTGSTNNVAFYGNAPAGSSWNAQSQSFPLFIFQRNVWVSPSFVAVGDGGAAATSPNGVVYTQRTVPASNWRGLAWNGTVFSAVASGGAVLAITSPDGITWTNRTAPAGFYQYELWSTKFSRFVALSSTSAPIHSPDGITWTAGTIPAGTWRYAAEKP